MIPKQKEPLFTWCSDGRFEETRTHFRLANPLVLCNDNSVTHHRTIYPSRTWIVSILKSSLMFTIQFYQILSIFVLILFSDQQHSPTPNKLFWYSKFSLKLFSVSLEFHRLFCMKSSSSHLVLVWSSFQNMFSNQPTSSHWKYFQENDRI